MGVWHEINGARHRQAHQLTDNAVAEELLVGRFRC